MNRKKATAAIALLAASATIALAGCSSSDPTTSAGGAASRMTCALVPLIPNDEIPARRGRSSLFQVRASVNSATEPADQSTCALGSSTCNVAGSISWRIANTILITPATPAAACVCPMLDFTDPSHSGSSRSCP